MAYIDTSTYGAGADSRPKPSPTDMSNRSDRASRILGPTSNVVPMPQKTCAEFPGDRDYKDLLFQVTVGRIINRKWGRDLSHPEFRLISFIVDQTVSWSRETRLFTYRFMQDGDPHQGEHSTRGTGMGRTQLYTAAKSLEEKGIITIDRSDTRFGLRIAVNVDWDWEKNMIENGLSVPKKKQAAVQAAQNSDENDDGWAETRSEIRTTPVRETEPLPFGNPNDIKEHSFSEHSFSEQENIPPIADALAEDWDFPKEVSSAPLRPTPSPVLPIEKTIPPVPASPPSASGNTTVATLIAHVEATRARITQPSKPAPDPRQTLKPAALEATMRRMFEQTYAGEAGAFFEPWTDKQRGMINASVLKRWPADRAEECHEFFEWFVRDWDTIRFRLFDWMGKKPGTAGAPEYPSASFLIRFRSRLVPHYLDGRHKAWIAAVDDVEERKRLELARAGKTAEEILLILAEDRAVAKLREEVAKEKAAALAIREEARLAKKAAERIKLAKGYVHPESQVAKEQQRAERDARLREQIGEVDPNMVIDLVGAFDQAAKNAPDDWGIK